jgi:hypothetical protein
MEEVKDDLEEKLEPDQIAPEQKTEAASEEPAKNKSSSS